MTMFWIGGAGTWDSDTAGHWSNATGGASNGTWPISTTPVVFDTSSGSGVCTLANNGSGGPQCQSLTNTASSISMAAGSANSISVQRSTDISGFSGSLSGVGFSIAGTVSCTFKSGGKTISSLSNLITGTLTLSDALVVVNSVTTSGASFSTGSNNVTANDFSFSTSGGTLTLGSSTITLSATSGTVWSMGSGTLSSGTSTINLTGSGSLTFNNSVSGNVYNNFWNACSSGTCQFNNDMTFNDFKANAGLTLKFNASKTTTVTTFSVNGTPGNLVTLVSATPTSQYTLTKAGGGTIICDYLSITDANATPSSTWRARSSTNVSNNTGWTFVPPNYNFLAYF